MGRELTALLVAALLLTADPVHAEESTQRDVRALAAAARSDPRALDQLRRIDTVDGRPVDLARALSSPDRYELDRRLTMLAEGGAAPDVDAASARNDARSILRGRKYRPAGLPRPFAGPLRRLGDVFRGAADAIASRLPGGRATLWTILALLVIALSLLTFGRIARRRGGASAPDRPDDVSHPSARRLEREAEQAERDGQFAHAVRLRFVAGLMRLGERGVIDYHAGVRSRQVARALGGRSFTPVARSFDEITYGGREASVEDAKEARAGWRRVLEEAVPR